MGEEKNELYFANIAKIVEKTVDFKEQEIILEKVIDKPFEDLVNQSKLLLNIKKEIETTLKNDDNSKEEVMIAGNNKSSFLHIILSLY